MKTVFLTGATGAIGSALVPLFLEEKDTQIRLLIRAKSDEHLQKRLNDLLKFWGLELDPRIVPERIKVFQGDVSLPQLGLGKEPLELLAKEVTHVVHTAGNVRFNQTLENARRDALDPARFIVQFAKTCQANGQFQKLEYVSTIGVCGNMRGLIPETPFFPPRTFRNTYEAAKAEAEDFILQEMKKGLPMTIHRPSMVVGDSSTGKIIHFQVFYHLSEFFSGKKTWGFVPETGSFTLDTIPADYVAKAIYLSSNSQEACGRIFHLVSGPSCALPLSELSERWREIYRQSGQNLPALRKMPLPLFYLFARVFALLGRKKSRRFFASLPFFLVYFKGEQRFDNMKTQAFFSKSGLSIPPVQNYLNPIMLYYLSFKKPVLPMKTGNGGG